MKSYKELGNCYLKQRKKRSLLVVLGLTVTTMFIYVVTTLCVNTVLSSFNEQKRKTNYHIVICNTTKEQGEFLKDHELVKSEVRAKVESNKRINGFAYAVSQWICLEDVEQDIFGWELIEGKMPGSENEVAISEAMAKSFSQEKKPGDTITEYKDSEDGKTYTICGILTRSQKKQSSKASIRAERDLFAVTLAGKDMQLDSYVRYKTPYDLKDPFNFSQWQDKAAILCGQMESRKNELVDRQDTSEHATDTFINTGLAMYYMQNELAMAAAFSLVMIAFLMVFLCSCMVRNMFSANLIDRLSDFSILKSMGASDKQLKAIFMRECLLEGAVSYVLAVALGNALIYAVFYGIFKLRSLSLDFSVIACVCAAVFAYFTLLMAVIEPFKLLKRISVMEGIRQQYAVGTKDLKRRSGGLFRIFGIEGAYAYKNMRRNNKSFKSSVSAFTISVLIFTILVSFMFNLMNETKTTVGHTGNSLADIPEKQFYDIKIASDFDGDLNRKKLEGMVDSLNAEPYVEDVQLYASEFASLGFVSECAIVNQDVASVMQEGGVRTNVRECMIVEFLTKDELVKMEDCIEGGMETIEAIQEGGLILVNTLRIGSEDVQLYNFKVGDPIMWYDLDGYGAYKAKDARAIDYYYEEDHKYESYEIKGFASRAFYDSTVWYEYIPSAIMSYEYLQKRCGQDIADLFCNAVFVSTNEDFDEDAFGEIVLQNNLSWTYLDNVRVVSDRFKPIIMGIGFVVVLVALIGVINIFQNMINDNMTRRREIALMRAVGMSKKGLNKMLILEKLIIGLISWVIGTVLGAGIMYLILNAYLHEQGLTFRFAWGAYLAIGILVIGIMLLTSCIMIQTLGVHDVAEDIRNND